MATKTTMMSDEFARSNISARLYQPEKKFMKMAATIKTAKGSPIPICLSTFFRRSL